MSLKNAPWLIANEHCFYSEIFLMNWLDPIGAGLSLICTYYFTGAHRFAWILGIAAVLVNMFLYLQKGIYGQLTLEFIYLGSMIYGWHQWSTKNKVKIRPIRFLTLSQSALISLVAIVSIILFAKALSSWTNSDVPYWDATVTILSLIAQILLCLKFIHCWVVWFVADALIALLQWYKGIPFHSILHWIYLGMAVTGYYRWHKLSQGETQNYGFRQEQA